MPHFPESMVRKTAVRKSSVVHIHSLLSMPLLPCFCIKQKTPCSRHLVIIYPACILSHFTFFPVGLFHPPELRPHWDDPMAIILFRSPLTFHPVPVRKLVGIWRMQKKQRATSFLPSPC